jgi:hypothetical protein
MPVIHIVFTKMILGRVSELIVFLGALLTSLFRNYVHTAVELNLPCKGYECPLKHSMLYGAEDKYLTHRHGAVHSLVIAATKQAGARVTVKKEECVTPTDRVYESYELEMTDVQYHRFIHFLLCQCDKDLGPRRYNHLSMIWLVLSQLFCQRCRNPFASMTLCDLKEAMRNQEIPRSTRWTCAELVCCALIYAQVHAVEDEINVETVLPSTFIDHVNIMSNVKVYNKH